MAHGEDLRVEIHGEGGDEGLAPAVMRDYRGARLTSADRSMLDYAIKLTLTPAAMTEGDVAALRAAGFGDVAIHDIAQVTALFAYYNRLAEGLGIDPEPEWPPYAELLGDEGSGDST